MKQTVYLEATIFSFYDERRTSATAIAMRDWTRQWWDEHKHEYDVATSTAVLAELDAAGADARAIRSATVV